LGFGLFWSRVWRQFWSSGLRFWLFGSSRNSGELLGTNAFGTLERYSFCHFGDAFSAPSNRIRHSKIGCSKMAETIGEKCLKRHQFEGLRICEKS
jgi:hypothetical protein